MDSDKKRKLEMTVAALQDRWGGKAVRRLRKDQTAPVPHVPTGFPPLDEVLTIGGLPRGRISEIIGIPTSGMATIALKIAANAQEQTPQHPGGTAIYVDPGHTFDPDYAARCGLELSQLVLVRPYDGYQALAILQDFVLSFGPTDGGIGILVFDTPFEMLAKPQPAQALSTALNRLIAPLSQTNSVLLFLTSLPSQTVAQAGNRDSRSHGSQSPSLNNYPSYSNLPHYAAVRLFIQREHWIYKQRDIRGYQAQVLVVKNKLGPAGKQVSVAITFNGTVIGDE